MKKLSESIWSDMEERGSGLQVKSEDRPQDYIYWWKNIALPNPPKYTKNELRLFDFLYDLVIWKLERTMNVKTPRIIRIYFKNEDAWCLSIFHNTAHGADNYTMEANGTKRYSPVKFSDLSISEKRSIRYRLESKTFYVYKTGSGDWTEYILREEEEIKGEKGILLK